MASGIKSAGTDLDSIFNPRVSSARANVGIQASGVDLASRYEKTSGGDLAAGATNWKTAGSDLQTLFQRLGYVALQCNLNIATANGSGTGLGPWTTSGVTASGANGTPGYTYLWSYVSGDASISVSSSTSASVTWSATGASVPSTKNAVWKCTVTDSASHTADSINVSVSINFNGSSLSASLSPTTLSGTGSAGGSFTVTTSAPCVCTPSGGTGPYSYLWNKISGDVGTNADSPTSASTTFSRLSVSPDVETSTWQCRVTDSLSNVVQTSNHVDVTLNFT